MLTVFAVACGPVPTPFKATDAEKLENPLIAVRAGAGVTVAPPIGAPPAFSGPITEALVEALIEDGIPASAAGTLTNGLLLEGTVFQSTNGASLAWTIRDTKDEIVDHVVVALPGVNRAALRSGEQVVIDKAVLASVESLKRLLRPGPNLEPQQRSSMAIFIAGVRGAPGNGNQALARAMEGVLKQADVPVTGAVDQNTLTLAATVQSRLTGEDGEEVTIIWSVVDPEGLELSTLEQKNVIPRGALSGRWGGIAYDIALANLEGIQLILRRYSERP